MAKKTSKASGSQGQGNKKPSDKKLGDKKLSATELETYKNRLVSLHTRIRGDVATMAEGTLRQSRSEAAGDLSAMPLHMADIGTDNFEREHTLSFIQSDSKTLKLIEEALARIKAGTYGICEDCGCAIPKVRLNFLPYTASCVRCVELAQQDR